MTPGLGTPIGAIAKGRVNYINYGYDHLGVYVEVEHIIAGVRVTSVYGHLGRNTVAVTQGQEVNVGMNLPGLETLVYLAVPIFILRFALMVMRLILFISIRKFADGR